MMMQLSGRYFVIWLKCFVNTSLLEIFQTCLTRKKNPARPRTQQRNYMHIVSSLKIFWDPWGGPGGHNRVKGHLIYSAYLPTAVGLLSPWPILEYVWKWWMEGWIFAFILTKYCFYWFSTWWLWVYHFHTTYNHDWQIDGQLHTDDDHTLESVGILDHHYETLDFRRF